MELNGNYTIIRKDNNIYKYDINYDRFYGKYIAEYLEKIKKNHHVDKFLKTVVYTDIYTLKKIYHACILFGHVIQIPLEYKGINYNIYENICGSALSVWGGNNYYHFMSDELIHIIKLNMEFGDELPIITSCNKSFCHEILKMLGINNRLIFCDGNITIKTDELILFNENTASYMCKENVKLLRTKLLEKKIIKFEKKKKGIIINRKEYQRQITNFNLFVEMLRTIFDNIEWVIFDSMNIKDTIQLYSECSYIIGVQGAGLANMLFAPEEIKVIEIAPINFPHFCYLHLSSMLNNEHYMYTTLDDGRHHVNHITLDLIDFFETFKDIII
jgi:hypothetical protein